MPHTSVNDVELYYEVHGQGTPLLLVAGLASDSQSWQPIIGELSCHYRVIVFDNRGAGRTRPQEVETSISAIADDCVALLHHLGLTSANFLGHSMGGFVALECAVRYPLSVSSLILAATSACNGERNNALFHDWASYLESDMPPELWFRNLFYWIFSASLFEGRQTLDEFIRYALEYPYPQSKLAFRNQTDAIKAYKCSADLSAIGARTLVISGGNDLLFPAEQSRKVLSEIPGAEFTVIEDAAHSLHVERPEEFIATVCNFIDTTQNVNQDKGIR